MPFTLAHPIAALPLWWGSRQRLDLPALMVGSLVPDLSYYLHLQPVRNSGHTVLGALQIGVPWGMLLLIVSAYWLKRPCLSLFPILARVCRPRPYTLWPWPRLAMIVLSLYLGAIGHIVWDSFTHRGGWAVQHWSNLAIPWGPLPVYAWLQYSGGVLGLAGLLLWGLWRYYLSPDSLQQQRPPQSPFKGFRPVATLSTLLLALTFAYIAATLAGAEPGFRPQVVRAVIGTVTGGSLGLLLCSGLFWLWTVTGHLWGGQAARRW